MYTDAYRHHQQSITFNYIVPAARLKMKDPILQSCGATHYIIYGKGKTK